MLFTSAPDNSSAVDVGRDVFLLDGTTANIWLNGLAAANSTTTVRFVASTSINLTASTGHDIVTALKGTNTFTSDCARHTHRDRRAGGTFLDLADGPHHYVQVDLKGVIVGTNTSISPPWGEPPHLVVR